MSIKIIAVGHRLPAWINTGIIDYAKRIPANLKLDIIEIPLQKRSHKHQQDHARQRESDAILKHIIPREKVIALTINGKTYDTQTFAQQLNRWLSDDLVFLIGGPEGLSEACVARADSQLSLSSFTLPHAVARLLLIEQLYRGLMIIKGHPYHRD